LPAVPVLPASTWVLRFAQDDKRYLGMTDLVLHNGDVHPSQTRLPRYGSVTIMRPEKTYFVYIMTNRSKTLYTGVTDSLIRRVREHKLGIGSKFTSKYKLDRLAYFERFQDVHNAIEREKQIKGWLRIKKIALIVSVNPAWSDLSLEWYERHEFQPEKTVLSP
jgi:putative endonuclease